MTTISVDAAGQFGTTGQMIYQEPDTAWRILGSADFNFDGRSDLVWRNDATGAIFLMLMNGPAIQSQAVVHTEPDPAWKIVALGDYNGDGNADVLWRNEVSGQVYMIELNGLAIVAEGMVYHDPDTAWRILGPGQYAQ